MWRAALFLLILVNSAAAQQCKIPESHRVFNKSGKQCVWASLETLARYNKIEPLYGLTTKKSYQKGANYWDVNKALEKHNVRFKMTYHSDKKNGLTLLKKYVSEYKVGAAFAINRTTIKHMVTMVHIDDEKVQFIDNSDKELRVRTWSMKTFKENFDGWVVVIYRVKGDK